jgi:hypothetical protein
VDKASENILITRKYRINLLSFFIINFHPMKIRASFVLFCIFFFAMNGFTQIPANDRPPVPPTLHQPGLPTTLEQAMLESAFSPAAPGYWAYDSSYYYKWLEPAATWYLWEKYFTTYNIAGSLTEGLYLNYDSVNGIWNNFTRYVNVYNSSNTVISRTGQAWNTNTSAWVDFSLTHYDAQGLVDESFYRSFDRVTNQFTSGSRSLYTFDAAGNCLEWILQDFDTATDAWVNLSKYLYTYSPTNKITNQLYLSWNEGSSTWDNAQNFDYSYDANDFLTGYMFYVWETGAWRNNIRATYTNNSAGNPSERLFELWIVGPDTWQNYQYDVIQYDANDQTTEFFTQYWNAGITAWEDYRKVTYTYHPNQYMESQLEEKWNPLSTVWMDTYYYLADSNGSNLEYYSKYLDYITYLYTSGYRYSYEYNSSLQPVLTLQQDLDASMNTWYDVSQRITSYDPVGNMVLELDQNWDAAGSIWKDMFKMEHYYSEHLGLPEPEPLYDLCYFANPLKKNQPVQCPNLDPSKHYTLRLFTMKGQQVFNAEITAGQAVSIPGNVSSGAYLMQIWEKSTMITAGKVVISE